jgi:hypothetical protein
MKKIILIAVLSLMALPVFGAVNYSRTPVGTEITSPVSISVSFDNFSEFGLNEEINYYVITIAPSDLPFYYSSCYASTTLSTNSTISVPVGKDIYSVYVGGREDNLCLTGGGTYALEGDGESVIFTILETPSAGVPSLFSLAGGVASTSEMLATTGVLFTDLWVIIALAIGVPLAFYVINRFIGLGPKDKAR